MMRTTGLRSRFVTTYALGCAEALRARNRGKMKTENDALTTIAEDSIGAVRSRSLRSSYVFISMTVRDASLRKHSLTRILTFSFMKDKE